MPDDKDKKRMEALRLLSLITNIGLTTAGCIVFGILIGRFLDDRIGTSPLFLLIFLFLGIAAAFKNIYDISQRIK